MKLSNVIFHPTNNEELDALKAIGKALRLKFEITTTESPYNPEFVEKIHKSKKQYKEGDFTTVKKEDLNKLLGLYFRFYIQAKGEIEFFKKAGDKSILKKINVLLLEIIDKPFDGTGKPEALKYDLQGFWSRRINREHRMVYEVLNDKVIIHSLKGHYL